MKILHIIPYFNPKRGGDVNVCYNLSKQLVKRGQEVTIITTDFEFDEEYAKIIEKEGVKVIPFHCLANISLFLISPSIKRWLKGNIRKFDIVHMHTFRSYQNSVVHHYAPKYNIPYILQAHGDVPYANIKDRRKKVFDIIFGYRILRNALKVIAVSKAEVEQYKQAGINEDKIVPVPDGIDVNAFKNLPTYGKFREKYDIKEKRMILFLGLIHKRKGIDFLIKSFSELTKESNDVVLVVIGPDDGYKVEIEKLITALNLGNRIKLMGYVDEKDKISAYIDADILVYPGILEIFGLVPFEAIMCGTPVIVTDDCGCGELVEASGAGYLVEYGDIEGLKERMKEAIENPEEGEKMVKKGKKYIEENLSWDKVVKEVEKVYEGATK